MIEIPNGYNQWMLESVSGITNTDAKKSQIGSSATFSAMLKTALDKTAHTARPIEEIFDSAAKKYGIPSELLKIIGWHESGFTPDATSKSGAMGIMQLMPTTAQTMGVQNAYDPEQNIMGGAKLIAQLLEQYDGNLKLAMAAYGAGSGAVAKYGGVPPYKETQDYVTYVLENINKELLSGGEWLNMQQQKAGTSAMIEQPEIVTNADEITYNNHYQSTTDVFDKYDVLGFLRENTTDFTESDYRMFVAKLLYSMQMSTMKF